MKKILITGVNGYIGTAFAEYLKQWPESYQADKISLRGSLWRSVDFSAYDVIVHAAGLAHVKETQENAQQYYEINRDLTAAVAEKAKAEGVGQFIYISSMSVYGLKEGVITPETLPAPKTHYGMSKLQAEQKLQTLCDKSFKVTIIRPPMVYGKGCKGNYQTLRRIALRFPVFPAVGNTRSILFIDNLCEFKRVFIENAETGVYFPQNMEYVSTADMVKAIAKANGRRICVTKLLTPLVQVAKAVSGSAVKAFGSLIYEQNMSRINRNYWQCSFEESVLRTEKQTDLITGGFQGSISND